MPPLRERKEDIPLLLQHFLNRFGSREGKVIEGLSPNAMKALTEYHWPGNVRELENTVERLVVFARDKIITTQDLAYSNTVLSSLPVKDPLCLEEMERLHIMKVVELTEGNKTRAARLLGIDRKTLRMKIKKHQIPENSNQNF
jgi:DNA-binding NtrC family response regulator